MVEWFLKGGVAMYPLLLCSVGALAISLERFFTLSRARVETQDVMTRVAQLLRGQRVGEALQYCEHALGPAARIVRAGLLKHGAPVAEVRETIERAGASEVPKLEQHLTMLATIAQVATLLGLLGTVLGLVQAFRAIEAQALLDRPVNPGDLAGGIWEALITTVVGLTIAIPTILAHNYLANRVGALVGELEQHAASVLDLLSQRGRVP